MLNLYFRFYQEKLERLRAKTGRNKDTPQMQMEVSTQLYGVDGDDDDVAKALVALRVKAEEIQIGLDGIGTLRPFARASVIPMPTPAQLRTELEASTHFREYEIQASKGGSGRFNWVDPAFNDPRRWIPIMMSPVLGNPHGNTLQEFHYQSRCIDMVGAHETEARRG